MKPKLLSVVSAFLLAGLTTVASVQAMDFVSEDDAVYLRKSQMGVIGSYFGDMGAMMKGKKPFDAAQFQSNADKLAVISQWAGNGFGSKAMTSDSKAKERIWENKSEFDGLMKDMAAAAQGLKTAAASGSKKDALPAFKKMAGTCGSCHREFKHK